MNATTDWGDIEQDILAQARTLVNEGVVRQADAATSEQAADNMNKSFPSLVFVFQPVQATTVRATGDGGFTLDAYARWVVYQYGTSGKQDSTSRYGQSGIFAVNRRQRECLNGFFPSSQISNSSVLVWRGCSAPEPYGGTGALKIASTYELEQLIRTV